MKLWTRGDLLAAVQIMRQLLIQKEDQTRLKRACNWTEKSTTDENCMIRNAFRGYPTLSANKLKRDSLPI